SRGWPAAPGRRKPLEAAQPERSSLREATICWPSEQGWPHGDLNAANTCEPWLLAVKPDGTPDITGVSFTLTDKSRDTNRISPPAQAMAAPDNAAGVPGFAR